jgi:hypothetical protein
MGIKEQLRNLVRRIMVDALLQLLRKLLEILTSNPGDDNGSDKRLQR